MNFEKQNHFQKFNLEEKFDIDLNALETNYLELQKQFHPDNSLDPVQDEINSILINQAYKILKNSISRGIYLLELEGININSEECVVKPSSEILMFIMELREEVLDNKDDEDKIDEIKENIKKLISNETLEVSDLLIKKQYPQAAQKLIKVKYLDKIISDLKK